MQRRFIIFMSTLFLLSPMSSRAALIDDSKFITEADIPKMTIAKYLFAGLVTGMMQQAATFATVPSELLSPQWVCIATGSIVAFKEIDDNIHILKRFDDKSIDWVYDELTQHNIKCSMSSFKTQFHQLRNGQLASHSGCSSQDIYRAYNKLLTRSVKKEAFVGGYTVASVLGPLPSMAAAYTLIQLIQCGVVS